MSHIALDARDGKTPTRNRRDNNWPDTPKCSTSDLVAEFTRHLSPWAKQRLFAVEARPVATFTGKPLAAGLVQIPAPGTA